MSRLGQLAINQSFLRTAVGASGSRGEECFARNRQGLQDLGFWSNSWRIWGWCVFEAKQGTR